MYFRAFYRLELPISENNCLLEDIEIPFETDFGEAIFQIQASDLSGLGNDLFSCVATIKCQPDKRTIKTFSAIRDDTSPASNPMKIIDESGEFHDSIEEVSGVKSLPGFKSIGSWSWIDNSFWNYVLEAKSSLDNYSLRLVDLVCWRCGFIGRHPVTPSELLSFLWSLDAATWFQLPLIGVGRDPYEFKAEVSENNLVDIQNYLMEPVESPLGLKIFHQAWTLRESYPQVALVIAISAAEVEIKRFLAKFEPQESDELTLFKILERLKKTISFNQISFTFPHKIIESIDKGRLIRNKVIHAGKEIIEPKDLEAILIAVRDFLCLIDLFQGYKWSRDFLSAEINNYF
jgi:hypothetical protein